MLVKQLWIHVIDTKGTIFFFVMNRKIVVTEKLIIDIISHNGCGKRVYKIKTDATREFMVAMPSSMNEPSWMKEKVQVLKT